jgi:hypothetical protein
MDDLLGASRYLSAAQDAVVGGDLYDCSVTEGYTRFIVGDVRGKGLAAVEQAARTIRAFRQAAATKETLLEAAHDMNGYMLPFLADEEFVTALLADLSDPDTITLVSCGHPPPLLVSREGQAEFLEPPPGLPLGLGNASAHRTFRWRAGDRLLLYTDGLSECRDADGTFLPLLELAPVLHHGSVEAALDNLLDRVRLHVPGGALGDDLAVVLLEKTTPGHSTAVSPATTAWGQSPPVEPAETLDASASRSAHQLPVREEADHLLEGRAVLPVDRTHADDPGGAGADGVLGLVVGQLGDRGLVLLPEHPGDRGGE